MSTLRATFDEQFEHTWLHMFDRDMPAHAREAWISKTLKMSQEAGIALIHRETENGVEFAFYDHDNWAAFGLNLTAQEGGQGNHQHIHHFDSPELQDAWTSLAQSYLKLAGIECEIEKRDGETVFHFSNLSDRVILNQIINNGTLDNGADALLQVRRFQDRLKDLNGPHPEL